jgi:hypothetical protein
MLKTLRSTLMVVCTLSLAACGGTDVTPEETVEDPGVNAMLTCYAYLLDGPNFSGAQLSPWPVVGGVGSCINLPAVSDNLTSSFRLANCGAYFFDGPGCTGAFHQAPTSGTMPVAFDNLTTSLRFY